MKLDEDVISTQRHERKSEERLGRQMPLDRKEAYGSEESVSPEIGGSSSKDSSEDGSGKKQKSKKLTKSLKNDPEAKAAAKLLEGKNGVEETKKPDNDNESSAGKPPKEISDAAKKASGEGLPAELGGEKPVAELDPSAAKADD